MTAGAKYYIPALVLLGILVGAPSLATVLFSFTNITSRTLSGGWDLTLTNVHSLGTNEVVRESFVRTIEIALVAVVLEVVLGLAIALLLHERGVSSVVERLFTVPMVASPLAVGIIWKLLFTENGGFANAMMARIGGDRVAWMSVVAPTTGIGWFDSILINLSINAATGILVLADVWQWTPLVVLIVLARIAAIPRSFREAALVDGLSRWQYIRAVVLPLLRPTVAVVACIRVVDTMKIFETVWVLFGNSVATATASVTIVESGLVIRKYGQAAAVSLAMLAVSSILVMFIVRLAKRAA